MLTILLRALAIYFIFSILRRLYHTFRMYKAIKKNTDQHRNSNNDTHQNKQNKNKKGDKVFDAEYRVLKDDE